MKKCNLLVILLIMLSVCLTGCAKEEVVEKNPFIGSWTGTVDLTEQVVDSLVAEDASLEAYAEFENLAYTYVFEFSDGEVSLRVDDSSKMQFVSNMENGIANMVDAMVLDVAEKNGITVEKVYEGIGLTRDEYIGYTVETMQLDAMVDAMASALELKGVYEYDNDKIVVCYDDSTYEEMKYVFEGEDLTITVSNGTEFFEIPCTKVE